MGPERENGRTFESTIARPRATEIEPVKEHTNAARQAAESGLAPDTA